MMHTPSDNNKTRIAVLSCAHTGHAASYSRALGLIDGAELAGFYDADHDRGGEYADRFQVPYYPDLDEILGRGDIQGVIICSETDRHRDLVKAAARAGKHILLEKPVATQLSGALEISHACQLAGVLLQIAYVCRFYPIVQTARRMVQAGEIGQVLGMVGGNRGRPPLPPYYPEWITDPRQSGGGALLDHSVHVTDTMRFILGEEVESVFAQKGDFSGRGLQVEDCGLIALTFRGGIIASVDPSWSIPENNPYHYDFYLQILGEKGILTIDDTRQAISVVSDLPSARPVNSEPFGVDVDVELVRHFVACIRAQKHLFPAASAADGLRGLEIALAAYRSIESGQPVSLPLEVKP